VCAFAAVTREMRHSTYICSVIQSTEHCDVRVQHAEQHSRTVRAVVGREIQNSHATASLLIVAMYSTTSSLIAYFSLSRAGITNWYCLQCNACASLSASVGPKTVWTKLDSFRNNGREKRGLSELD
jgi:hypothetical protein